MKFTKQSVAALCLPEGKSDAIYFDDSMRAQLQAAQADLARREIEHRDRVKALVEVVRGVKAA